MEQKKRSSFSSRIGFVLAAAGSAGGLGNRGRFPYLAARYGGGIFLLVYLILALTFGFSLMITEIAIGRKTRLSCIGAYKALDKRFGFLGWLAAFVPFIITPYYCVIGGWVIKYLVEYFMGHGQALASDEYFSGFISNGLSTEICFLVFTFITLGIIYAGVRNGIERVSKFMIQYLCPIFAAIILISSVANAFGWISM